MMNEPTGEALAMIANLRMQLETAELQRDAARDAVVGLQAERAALRALLKDERQRSAIAKNDAADLRRQLDAARAELINARALLGEPVGVDIAIIGLLAEAANLRRQLEQARAEIAAGEGE